MDTFTVYKVAMKMMDGIPFMENTIIGKLYVYTDGISIQSEDDFIREHFETLFARGTQLILPARGKSRYEEIIPEEERIGDDDFLQPREEKEVKPGDHEYAEALGYTLPKGYALSRDGEPGVHARP